MHTYRSQIKRVAQNLSRCALVGLMLVSVSGCVFEPAPPPMVAAPPPGAVVVAPPPVYAQPCCYTYYEYPQPYYGPYYAGPAVSFGYYGHGGYYGRGGHWR